MRMMHSFAQQVGGPIALVKNGDPIRIDARPDQRTIDLLISDEEWEKRRSEWTAPPLRANQGTLFKYIQCVATASEGCVTDEVGTASASEIVAAAPKTPAIAELETYASVAPSTEDRQAATKSIEEARKLIEVEKQRREMELKGTQGSSDPAAHPGRDQPGGVSNVSS